jgi:hypothetical protein
MTVFILKSGLRDVGGSPKSSTLKKRHLRVDYRDVTESWLGGLK